MTREELWISRINDYRAGGERVAVWCQRHQVTPYQLFYWMRKLNAAGGPKSGRKAGEQTPPASRSKWISLRLDDTASDGAAPIVVRVGTVAVEVRAGFEPGLFADVVRTLKALC